jgi:flagellar protein FlaF
MARTAYGAPGTPVRSARSTEYDLFARVTRRLREAAAPDRPAGRPADRLTNRPADGLAAEPAGRRPDRAPAPLVRALDDNLRLWTTLAVDVADEGNGLPRELRARLFYLAEFTRAHTRKVLKGEAAAGVLVEINTAVMRGLAAREGGA